MRSVTCATDSISGIDYRCTRLQRSQKPCPQEQRRLHAQLIFGWLSGVLHFHAAWPE